MAKYSYEFKKKLVMEYIDGGGGYQAIARKYSVPFSLFKRWTDSYKIIGDEALQSSKSNKNYSLEYKINIVGQYLSGELSYQDLANQEKINNYTVIVNWVSAYRKYGLDGLKSKKRGRPPKSSSSYMENKNKSLSDDKKTIEEKYKELQENYYHLKLENACLKELRRLRLEEEALNKKRELSTVSEDHSN